MRSSDYLEVGVFGYDYCASEKQADMVAARDAFAVGQADGTAAGRSEVPLNQEARIGGFGSDTDNFSAASLEKYEQHYFPRSVESRRTHQQKDRQDYQWTHWLDKVHCE